MREIKHSHPVKIPSGESMSTKAQKRYDSGFSPSLTIDEALRYFEEECQALPEAASITLHSNYDRITVPRLRQMVADNSAVCCEIRLNAKSYYLFSHQWGLTEQNIYAIHLTLRAVHNIVKWRLSDYGSLLGAFGQTTAETIDRFVEDESELVSRGQWMTILRLSESDTLEEANAAYRFYAKKAAESEEGLLRLNQAIEAARKYFARRKGA